MDIYSIHFWKRLIINLPQMFGRMFTEGGTKTVVVLSVESIVQSNVME